MAVMEPPSVIVPVRVPVEHRNQLRDLAAGEDRTLANLIRRVLRLYLQDPARFDQPRVAPPEQVQAEEAAGWGAKS